jgi:hypothetical protein
MQRIGGNPDLVHAMARIVMDMHARVLPTDLEQVYVRAVLTGFVTGGILVVADPVTRTPDSLVAIDTIGTLIGGVNGQDAVLTVDDDKRFLVAVDQ